MRLVFKKSIFERQQELINSTLAAIHDARNEGKEVEKIVFTEEEWDLLLNYFFGSTQHRKAFSGKEIFYGYPVEVEPCS